MPPRRSMPASSAVGRRAPAIVVETTTYLPLQHPISGRAKFDLQAIDQGHALLELDALLKKAIDAVKDCAFEINELAAQHGVEQDQFRADVDHKTSQLDDSMRRLIDGRKEIEFIKGALHEATTEHGTQQYAGTQRTQTQPNTQRSRRHHQPLDEEDDDMDGTAVTTLTSDEQSPQVGPGPSQVFKETWERAREDYQILSPQIRYSEHPDYISFKGDVWESKYPDGNAPPLPHPSTWFNDRGSPAPGTNNMPDDDDDLQTIGVTISTKDPLTLQNIKEPVRSTKCTHHYEKASITQYISTEGRKNLPRNARPAIECPVAGCDKQIGLEDLVEDPMLTRKIKRVLDADRKRAMHAQNGDDGETTELIDVDGEEDDEHGEFDDIDEDSGNVTQPRGVKAEIRSSRY